jgi:hypothetical protein
VLKLIASAGPSAGAFVQKLIAPADLSAGVFVLKLVGNKLWQEALP